MGIMSDKDVSSFQNFHLYIIICEWLDISDMAIMCWHLLHIRLHVTFSS